MSLTRNYDQDWHPKRLCKIWFRLIVVIAAVVSSLCVNTSMAEVPSSTGPVVNGLLGPLAETQAVYADIGEGHVLRVPRLIAPYAPPASNPSKPVPFKSLFLTFWFPELAATNPTNIQNLIFLRLQHKYIAPTKDRFKVEIRQIFFSPDTVYNVPSSEGIPLDPFAARPHQVLEYLEKGINDFKPPSPGREVRLVKSDIPGTMEVITPWALSYIAARPDMIKNGKTPPDAEIDRMFIDKPGGPYELYMRCDPQDGLNCESYVFIKSTHLEYWIFFPREAASRIQEVIGAVNQLINSWSLNIK